MLRSEPRMCNTHRPLGVAATGGPRSTRDNVNKEVNIAFLPAGPGAEHYRASVTVQPFGVALRSGGDKGRRHDNVYVTQALQAASSQCERVASRGSEAVLGLKMASARWQLRTFAVWKTQTHKSRCAHALGAGPRPCRGRGGGVGGVDGKGSPRAGGRGRTVVALSFARPSGCPDAFGCRRNCKCRLGVHTSTAV